MLAIDASGEMLDLARRNLELAMLTNRIQLAQADCKSLQEFSPAMADVVISNSLLHHLAEPALAVKAATRLLRGGGRLFIRDLARPATLGDVERLVSTYANDEPEPAKIMFRDSLLAALSLEEARELFVAAGLAPQSVQMTSDRHWTFDGRIAQPTTAAT